MALSTRVIGGCVITLARVIDGVPVVPSLLEAEGLRLKVHDG